MFKDSGALAIKLDVFRSTSPYVYVVVLPAFVPRDVCVAVAIGLSKSAVSSTLPSPIISFCNTGRGAGKDRARGRSF